MSEPTRPGPGAPGTPDPASSAPKDPGFLRQAGTDLRDDALAELAMIGPVLVGAAVGWWVAGFTGLLVGGLVGATLVALWMLSGVVSLVLSAIRWVRRRGRWRRR